MTLFLTILKAQETIDLIDDYQFTSKIGLQGVSSTEPSVKAYLDPFNSKTNKSYWQLAEWGSKYDLINVKPIINKQDSSVSYFNKSKGVSFKRTNDELIISLEVLGSQEIDSARKSSDNFPGILLGQKLKSPIRINNFKELLLTLDCKLINVENHMNSKYSEALHTAQITLYFSLGNANIHSKGYGDYLWFGIPIYDYRFEIIESSWMQDTGIEGATQKFIYIPAARDFYSGSMHDKEWKMIKKDISKYLKEAFLKAKEMGYLRISNYEDMALTSTNFGWEMPGIFDGEFEFKNLRLRGILEK